ncbi:MAG: FGGY-family carbohydrate kinase [Winkia neuii]|uniref:Xylulose kinase n=1 Tax=Winkia neuii TaxID=33007 RepID=A0A2I1INJ6_9ACTO|nr:FGGY-family carbohydrate kinase [Winkia neuii]OFJ71783.1 xylulose kinase [Actinomyces sp. HMSC064C12]OFK01214.1 xylulose kinase [Actinomyces sp. HMSC072A03]OFT55746.1 xylulose kinase [Actinomyces sp. HMSC06A08]MDK8099071.1 FGGY-family carbohydrate kinase [Winkia neuii]MDU3134707.1 FGGY-family carbohydrate kinase [Winkia neuii]
MSTTRRPLSDGPLVVAIDSSTTSSKAILVDAGGYIWQTAKRNIQLHTPAMDYYEHNPLRWWESSYAVIGEVLSKLSAKDRTRVAAIGITHQRESFAPFDKEGRPLRKGILWLDGRATKQIRKYGSERIHELSGKPAGVTPGIYKMAWLKEEEPEVLRQAYKVSDVHGYIAFRLTGQWVSSQAATDSLGLLDIQKRTYAEELLQIAGVSLEQMPELVEPSKPMGTLLGDLAAEWGIREVPIVAGLGDGQAAGIGAAAVSPEIGFLNLGTAVNAGVESSVYKFDPVFRTHVSGIPGNYVFEVLQSSGSYLAGWFREALGDPKLLGEPDPKLDAAAGEIPPGCEGLITLPYWNAVQSPYWDPVARGAVVGWRGTHSRAHMYRSILESIGFEMRLNLDSIEAGTGVKLKGLRAMGGGTKSKIWRQIMADCTGLPITMCAESEISALGAAVLAMASTDAYENHDVAVAAKNMASFGETVEPNKELHERYQEIAEVQRSLYPRLKDIFEDLHQLAEKYPSTKPQSPAAEL